MLLLAFGCRQKEPMAIENAVYYWRTEWQLDSTEVDFLSRYDIHKVYCRYFDVVMADSVPVPNATITFDGEVPQGVEIIPTVYITEDCMHQRHSGLADRLVSRILQMNKTNDISGTRELQIDCDYTARSLNTYYDFLSEVRKLAADRGLRLSTTIRLHQLSMPVPPADYGVLMVYNTGDPRKFMERNPILDIRDVAPYLRRLDDYPIPLAAAYPVFSWLRIVNGVHIEHTAEAEEVLKVKQAVEQKRGSLKRSIITYHLDKENINRYKREVYEEIYHH